MADPGQTTPSPPSNYQPEGRFGVLLSQDSLRSDTDASEPPHPETKLPTTHEPDRPEKPRTRKSVEWFIKNLLEFVARGGKDTSQLMGLYDRPGPGFDPCLLRDGDMIYSLLPSFTTMVPNESAFDKDEEVGCLFARFDVAAKGEKISLGTATQPSYFLPLGRLVEKNIKTGGIRVTNYELCLNVTDNPISLWLVYDYPASNDDADVPDQEIPFGGIYDTSDYDPYFQVPEPLDKPSGASQMDKTPAFPRGLFLSLGHFDFAQMSEDICRDWIGHAIEGLDPFKVNDCMRRTLENYGGTLRAVETWPKCFVKESSN